MAESSNHDRFPEDPAGLPQSRPAEIVDLEHDDRFDLRIGAVAHAVGGVASRMLAYNGSIPGPVLRVPEGAEVTIAGPDGGDWRPACEATPRLRSAM